MVKKKTSNGPIMSEVPSARKITKLLKKTTQLLGDTAALRLLELALAHYQSDKRVSAFYDHAKEIAQLCRKNVHRENKNSDQHFASAKDLYWRNSIQDVYYPLEEEEDDWDQ